jgi:phage anti-repressor protein
MTTTALVPVFTGDNGTTLCNARDLHATLENGDHFATWIKERIEKYGFTEGDDFFGNSRKTRGRPATDYHLTLDMAKELAMVENNERGRQVRRYFIKLEKEARDKAGAGGTEHLQPPPPPSRRIRLPRELSLTARDSKGHSLDSARDGGDPSLSPLATRLVHSRFLLTFDDHGRILLREVPAAAFVIAADDFPKVIADPGGVPLSTLPAIIKACTDRLASQLRWAAPS